MEGLWKIKEIHPESAWFEDGAGIEYASNRNIVKIEEQDDSFAGGEFIAAKIWFEKSDDELLNEPIYIGAMILEEV